MATRDYRGPSASRWQSGNAVYEVAAGVLFTARGTAGFGKVEEVVDGDDAEVLAFVLTPLDGGTSYTAAVERSIDDGATYFPIGLDTGGSVTVAKELFVPGTPIGLYRINVSAVTAGKSVTAKFRKKVPLVR